MEILGTLLSPITLVMDQVLRLFHAFSGSYGIAIILLSLVVRVVTIPLSWIGRREIQRQRILQEQMAPALAAARAQLSGRARFERIEEIYTEHRYHPVHSMASLLPLAVQIPFLLSALLLLVDYPKLAGVGFSGIPDLSRPDGLLPLQDVGIQASLNVLPLLLTAVAIVESMVSGATRQACIRFLVIAVVLAVLIYPLPAAVCLYWLASNVWSLSIALLRGKNERA